MRALLHQDGTVLHASGVLLVGQPKLTAGQHVLVPLEVIMPVKIEPWSWPAALVLSRQMNAALAAGDVLRANLPTSVALTTAFVLRQATSPMPTTPTLCHVPQAIFSQAGASLSACAALPGPSANFQDLSVAPKWV